MSQSTASVDLDFNIENVLETSDVPTWRDWLCRRPAVWVAISLIAGIGLHDVLPAMPLIWLGATVGCVVLSKLVAGRRLDRLSSGLLLFACAMLGLGSAQYERFYFASTDLSHFSSDSHRLVQLRIYLPNEPRLRSGTFGQRHTIPPRQVSLVEVREVKTKAGWQPASGSALLQIKKPHPGLSAGQTVELIGLIERPGEAMNPGQFDWQNYYRQQRVSVSIHVSKPDHIVILSSDVPPWITRWRESVRWLLAAGFSSDQKLDHALVRQLVLGDYDPELRDVREQFRQTGTSHHLAISGMHIAIVGGFIFVLLRGMKVSPARCWIATMATVVVYGTVATPSPPVMRSVLLFVMVTASILLRRRADSVQLLCVAAALMLAVYPLDLFNAGFQLSFGTVLGLLILTPLLVDRLVGDKNFYTRSEIELMPLPQKAVRWFDDSAIKVVAAGVIAWLVSMPIVAMHFSQLNPWQVPASILLAPLVTLTLIAGVLKILLTVLLPSLASVFAWVVVQCSTLMRWGVGELARFPYSDIPLPAPSIWLAICCWISLALCLWPWRLPSVRWALRLACVGSYIALLALPYVRQRNLSVPGNESLRITILAVGAGQCVMIEPPGGRSLMIDCGSNSVTDLTNGVVAPFLRDRGITAIDTLLLTHANTDHYSAAAEVAQIYGIREVVAGHGFVEQALPVETGSALLADLELIDAPPRTLDPGDQIPLSRQTKLQVLWPSKGFEGSANDQSSVVRLTHAGRSILFTGDIQRDGMRGLIDSGIDLTSDVLIAPHHGSAEDVTREFIRFVDPKLIVASNDRTLTMKQRDFDRDAGGRPLLRTHRDGAVTLLIDEQGQMTVDRFRTGPLPISGLTFSKSFN